MASTLSKTSGGGLMMLASVVQGSWRFGHCQFKNRLPIKKSSIAFHEKSPAFGLLFDEAMSGSDHERSR